MKDVLTKKCSFGGSQGDPLEGKLGHIALKLASRRRLKTSYHQDGDLVGVREACQCFWGGSSGLGRAPGRGFKGGED